jgi:hypothetical protein
MHVGKASLDILFVAQKDSEVYCVEVSPGIDVALVTCITLIVNDWLALSGN